MFKLPASRSVEDISAFKAEAMPSVLACVYDGSEEVWLLDTIHHAPSRATDGTMVIRSFEAHTRQWIKRGDDLPTRVRIRGWARNGRKSLVMSSVILEPLPPDPYDPYGPITPEYAAKFDTLVIQD